MFQAMLTCWWENYYKITSEWTSGVIFISIQLINDQLYLFILELLVFNLEILKALIKSSVDPFKFFDSLGFDGTFFTFSCWGHWYRCWCQEVWWSWNLIHWLAGLSLPHRKRSGVIFHLHRHHTVILLPNMNVHSLGRTARNCRDRRQATCCTTINCAATADRCASGSLFHCIPDDLSQKQQKEILLRVGVLNEIVVYNVISTVSCWWIKETRVIKRNFATVCLPP